MAYRIANSLWALLFLYAAAVQYNDPDPLRWMFVYGLAAVFCGLAVRGELPLRPVLGYSVVAALLALATFTEGTGDSHPMGGFPHWGVLREEVVREGLGLGLVSVWMAVLWAWTRKIGASEE